MEHEREEAEERERSTVARGQNVLYVLPHDAAAVSQFLDPLLERIAPDAAETQLLVLTPDADTAVTVAEAATRARGGQPPRALPVTRAQRAARLLRARPATIVAGAPAEILELLRASAIKLGALRALVIAWADLIEDSGASEALAAVMSELPKEGARVIVTSQLTPAVEELVERYARRARRVGAAAPAAGEEPPPSVRYVVVAPRSRPTALRRLLDDLDPERAAVYVRSDEAEREVATVVRALGVGDGEPAVVVTRGDAVAGASLVVLYEFPLSTDVLRAVAGSTPAIALATPRQLAALRALVAGGRATPYTLSGPGARARSREERAREELRTVLDEGIAARELLSLEPLLAEHDGVEIAAAALRLLEREREQTRERTGPERTTMVRLYVNAGSRDDVTPRDLVGAITHEGGITGSQVGRIEVRDNHSLVEVAADVADKVVSALTGAELKGRRIIARVDAERPRGERPERGEREPRGDRPPRGGDRADRPPRSDRGDRFERGGRGERGARSDEGARRPPRDRFDRGERRERSERFERSERRGRDDRPRGPGGEDSPRPRRPRGE